MTDRDFIDQARLFAIAAASRCAVFLTSLAVLLTVMGCVQEAPSSSTKTVAILLLLLHDESVEVRSAAAESLGKIGDRTASQPVADLLTDQSPVVRRAAAQALGRVGASAVNEITPHLVKTLTDSSDSVRRAAAQALGDLEPPPELLRTMPELLASPHVEVRRAAVLALFQVDASAWLGILQKATQDSDAGVRQGAVAALGETGSPSILPAIRVRLQQDPDPAVRAEAAYRLRAVSDAITQGALKRAEESDENPTVRRWARRDATL